MNIFSKRVISLLIAPFIFLILNGCMTKQSDGRYHTKYSYHPYYDMYSNEMAGSKKTYTPKKEAYTKTSTSSHKVVYNDEENYPSNVAANSY